MTAFDLLTLPRSSTSFLDCSAPIECVVFISLARPFFVCLSMAEERRYRDERVGEEGPKGKGFLNVTLDFVKSPPHLRAGHVFDGLSVQARETAQKTLSQLFITLLAMGRSRASPPPAAKPAQMSRPSAPMSRPSAPPPAAPASKTVHVVHHQAAPAPAMGGGGSGLMGTIAATAVGSMAGNVIANRMFNNNETQPAQQQQQQPVAQSDPCKTQFEAYSKCMESGGNPQTCSWAWDMVSQCRRSNGLA